MCDVTSIFLPSETIEQRVEKINLNHITKYYVDFMVSKWAVCNMSIHCCDKVIENMKRHKRPI